jgi:hypothetical protein
MLETHQGQATDSSRFYDYFSPSSNEIKGRPIDPPHTGRLQNEYCEYAASAVYIIHIFYMNDKFSQYPKSYLGIPRWQQP